MHFMGGQFKNKYTFMTLDVKMHQKMKINI